MATPAVLLVVLVLVCGGVTQEDSTKWDCFHYGYADYNGPSQWKKFCHACGSCMASPIYIDRPGVAEIRGTTLEGSFFDVDRFTDSNRPISYLLENDGHGVNLRVVDTEEICIHGTNLDGEYCFDHLQFKWGDKDNDGAEHMLDIRSSYAMERQWAFYSKRYESYDEAIRHEGGVAMMGQPILMAGVDGAITMFDPIVKLLPDVREPGQVKRSDEPLPDLWLQPDYLQRNIFYNGTLTSPPCTKGVLWMIFAPQGYITKSQLAEFRKLMSPDGPLLENRNYNKFQSREAWSQTYAWLELDNLWPFNDLDYASDSDDRILGVARTAQHRGASRAGGTFQKHHKHN